ncbi:MAG TPA: methyltransferase domain-containing protein [Actinomycetota bacterium]|nr:methyltransferase domain-containing protein [Actinomycetota bacterium]
MSATAWSVAHGASAVSRSKGTVLRSTCGRTFSLSSDRWWREPPDEEARLLRLALSPVLDLGCGPGRHTVALSRLGLVALGVDSSAAAVAAARAHGAAVTHRSVFDRLPSEGRWGTALLLDGNVGIGGDPLRLFRRVRELLRPGGRALVEVEGPGVASERLSVRAELDGSETEWFPWARVGVDGVRDIAVPTGLCPVAVWSDGGRWFARLDAR